MCDNYVFDIDGTIVLNNEILSNQKEKILNLMLCIELIHHLEKNNVPFYLEFGDGIGISSNKKNDFLDILIAEASDACPMP